MAIIGRILLIGAALAFSLNLLHSQTGTVSSFRAASMTVIGAMDDGPPLLGGVGGGGGSGAERTCFAPQYTTNDLWLEIAGFTNEAASLAIHRPWADTNATHDLFCTTNLASPVMWRFLMRCASTNVLVPNLCDAQGFFRLGQTNGDLTVSTNPTPLQLAQLLVPPWVTVTNATYNGAIVARGTFAGGNGCGLPLESGVILSSGDIRLAVGPNDDPRAGIGNGALPDPDLGKLVGNGTTTNAAVLAFDLASSNSFVLQFECIFASEEYPEYISSFNDPMAIFVSTNCAGTNWIITPTNNIALVPGTSLPVTVNTINARTHRQYYVDNGNPRDPTAIAPEFNTQYNGMTVLLTAQMQVSANVIYHVKIGIEDYGDAIFDSAVFIKAWSPGPCCQCQ